MTGSGSRRPTGLTATAVTHSDFVFTGGRFYDRDQGLINFMNSPAAPSSSHGYTGTFQEYNTTIYDRQRDDVVPRRDRQPDRQGDRYRRPVLDRRPLLDVPLRGTRASRPEGGVTAARRSHPFAERWSRRVAVHLSVAGSGEELAFQTGQLVGFLTAEEKAFRDGEALAAIEVALVVAELPARLPPPRSDTGGAAGVRGPPPATDAAWETR